MFEKKSLVPRREDPFNLLRQMTNELDRVFDQPWDVFRMPLASKAAEWAPKIDVITRDNKLVTRVDLPGVKMEDVNVDVADGMLTLSGERKKEMKEEKDNYFRAEREYGSFCRTIALPKGVKVDDIKATFMNGVLEVSVPLPPAAVEPASRKIAISDGSTVKAA